MTIIVYLTRLQSFLEIRSIGFSYSFWRRAVIPVLFAIAFGQFRKFIVAISVYLLMCFVEKPFVASRKQARLKEWWENLAKRNENTNPRQPPLFSSSAKANPGLNEPSCSCTTIYAGIADTFLYVYCLSRGIKIDQTIQLSNQDNNTSEKIKGVRKIETVAGYLCRKKWARIIRWSRLWTDKSGDARNWYLKPGTL